MGGVQPKCEVQIKKTRESTKGKCGVCSSMYSISVIGAYVKIYRKYNVVIQGKFQKIVWAIRWHLSHWMTLN